LSISRNFTTINLALFIFESSNPTFSDAVKNTGGHKKIMKEKVYLDSTIPSYFHDDRESIQPFVKITEI